MNKILCISSETMRKMATVTNWICQSFWTISMFRILREVCRAKKCPFKTRSLHRQFHFATSNLLPLNSPSSKEWQNSNFLNNYSEIQPTRPPSPPPQKKKLTPTAKDDNCAINQRIDSNKTQTSLELQTLMQLSQKIMELWARKKRVRYASTWWFRWIAAFWSGALGERKWKRWCRLEASRWRKP